MSLSRVPLRAAVRLLSAVLLFGVVATAANAQRPTPSTLRPSTVPRWQPLGPMAGAGPWVLDLQENAYEPDHVYASSTAGILRSTDAGATWNVWFPLIAGDFDLQRFAVAPTDPSRVALESFLALRMSWDGGASFFDPDTPPAALRFQAIAFDPVDPDIVYCGTGIPSGVWRSLDGGRNFTMVFSTALTLAPRGILVDRNNRLRVFALTSKVLAVSHDGGDSWIERSLPSSLGSVLSSAIDSVDGRRVLLGTTTGVHLTEDEGISWIPLGLSWAAVDSVSFDTLDRGRFYAGLRYEGFALTADWGASWTISTDPGLDHMGGNPHRILQSVTHPGTVLVGGLGGIARSLDQATTFVRTNDGLEDNAYVQSIAVNSGDTRNLVAKTGGSAFASLDGGATWTESVVDPSFVGFELVADPHTPGRFWAGGNKQVNGTGGSLWRSDDGGFRFDEIFFAPSTYFWHLEPHPTQPDVLFGAGSGLLRSDDGGVTFVDTGLPSTWVWDVAISPADPNFLYGSTPSTVYFSHDGGATWTAATTPPPRIVRDLEVDPRVPQRCWACSPDGLESGRAGLYLSEDGGITWVAMSPATLGAEVAFRPASDPDLLLLGDLRVGPALGSVDGGFSVHPFGGDVGSSIQCFASTRHRLYAGSSGHGAFVLR